MKTKNIMKTKKIQWWLIAIPVILFLLPIPTIVAIIAAIAVGYYLYRQYHQEAERKKLLETIDSDIQSGNLDALYIEELMESYPDLMPVVTEKIRNWGKKQLDRFNDFESLVNDPDVEVAYNATAFGSHNTDELTLQQEKSLERICPIIEKGLATLVNKIASANTLDEVIDNYENIASRTIFYGELSIVFDNYMKDAYKTAIKRISEIPLPEKTVEVTCKFSDQSYYSEEDDASGQFENCVVRITRESFVVETLKVSHLKLSATTSYYDSSLPSEYEVEYESTDSRDDVYFKLKGSIVPLLAALEQRFISRAREERDNMIKQTADLNPMRFNDPVAHGRDCYYRGELKFSKKVAEDDSGELAVIAPEKDVIVYLFDKSLEFVSQDQHTSINIKDIMGIRINEHEDLFNVVRKGYVTPIGFHGDVLPLYKAIKALQERLLSQ